MASELFYICDVCYGKNERKTIKRIIVDGDREERVDLCIDCFYHIQSLLKANPRKKKIQQDWKCYFYRLFRRKENL